MHHGMVVEPFDRARRPMRVPPVGAESEAPPIRPVGEVDRALALDEDERARAQLMRQRARVVLRVRRDLGEGDMAGLFDETAELGIRYGRLVYPVAVHTDAMSGLLLLVMMV